MLKTSRTTLEMAAKKSDFYRALQSNSRQQVLRNRVLQGVKEKGLLQSYEAISVCPKL